MIIIAVFIAVLLTISSRIRNAASRAFEREEVETDEFSLVKPEGLIYPINAKSAYAFEAYTKDFGKGDAEDLRRAHVSVGVSEKDFSQVCGETKSAAGEILSEETARETCLIESKKTLENAAAYNFYKIIGGEKTYTLKISVLEDSLDDFRDKIDETLKSFRLK
jgi:hypothetical protein